MSEIYIHTRSFHPNKNFGAGGLGFEGDNRGFSLEISGVTSRIFHYIPVNLQSSMIGEPVCDSDPSQNAIAHHAVNAAVDVVEVITQPSIPLPDAPPMANDYSQVRKKPRHKEVKSITRYRVDGDQTLNITVTYAGKNFAFWFADTDIGHAVLGGPNSSEDSRNNTASGEIFAGRVSFNGVVPDLDVTNQIYLHLSREDGKATAMLNMSGDGFPNAESFIIDAAGKPLMLATHIRVGTPITQLPGGRAVRMCQTNLSEIDWSATDELGNNVTAQSVQDFMSFSTTDVAEGAMSVSGLNQAHLSRNASGAWHRQLEDHVPIPNARNIDILREDIVNGFRNDKEAFLKGLRTVRDRF